MIETRAATQPESASWLQDWRTRLTSWYDHADPPSGWTAEQVDGRVAVARLAEPGTVSAIISGEEVIGMVAMATAEENGSRGFFISDIWIAPQHRRRGHGTAALLLAEQEAKAHEARTNWVLTDPADPAHAALFGRYPVRAQRMMKRVSDPGPLTAGLAGRQMTEAEFDAWRAETLQGYAADIIDSGTLPAAEALAAAALQFDQLLPDGLATANHSFLSLCAGGEVVATNWIGHHRSPGTSWVYGVETRAAHRGKGYGRAAMIIGEQATLAAGDTHLGLNVFGHNDVAIRLYESMGYRAYDQGRSIDL